MAASEALNRDLAAMLGGAGVVPDDRHCEFETGARYGEGRAAAVVRPSSTAEVSAVVRYCFRHDLRMVPQGANTGLVGASVPDASQEQVVISMGRLDGLRQIDSAARTAVVSAGLRLSSLNQQAAGNGLFFPIDLGADPSIGGMLATNTGGSRLIRYGDVRQNTLGLEFVIADADGAVIADLRGLRKDNSALKLAPLIVGSGGALALVTAGCLNLEPLPRQTATALITPRNTAVVPEIIAELEKTLGETLAACEGLSSNAIETVLKHSPALSDPFGSTQTPPYALVVEAASSLTSGLDVQSLLEDTLARLIDGATPLVDDVLMDRGGDFWRLRHAVSESLKREGRVIGFDLSLPRARWPEFRAELLHDLASEYPFLKVCDFGHIGDGGDHFNVVWPNTAPDYNPIIVDEVRQLVYDCAVLRYGGSFSAEHGIGPHNLTFYRRYTSDAERALAASIKRLFDPKALLGHVDFA